ncbi:MAG: hypothetical protein QGF67_02020 [Lentisphaeria bacterium]|jgi:hypothetical protein|nr:hypothetical protein [Lentisphaeria bacterium]
MPQYDINLNDQRAVGPADFHGGGTSTFEKNTMPRAIRRLYLDPESLSIGQYVLDGQMFQAFTHGNAV